MILLGAVKEKIDFLVARAAIVTSNGDEEHE